MQATIKNLDKYGRTTEVRVLVDEKEFQARVVNGRVAMIHRVTQEYGGRAVGSTHDKYTSVSQKSPKYAPLAAAIEKAIDDEQVARNLAKWDDLLR